MRRIITAILAACICCLPASAKSAKSEKFIPAASGRVVRSINDAWNFTKDGVTTLVNVPHCINAQDTWDEVPGYWRGKCEYSRKVTVNDDLDGKKVYVRFEGVGQVAELLVNGRSCGTHIGSYTAFIFDITDAVRKGDNDFVVKVDNTPDPDITPLSADFTFYGGIYRDVNLVITPSNHICNTHYASNGVYITTPVVGETSTVSILTKLDVSAGKYVLRQAIYDPDGKCAATASLKLNLKENSSRDITQLVSVNSCRLWDVDSPNVYRVVTSLCDVNGNELDSVENPLGFRTFSFDAQTGFTLNGRHLKIMGTNRHQDYLEKGNALTDDMHLRDVMLLKEMGGNFLRIAHYPQDPIVTQTCDREGIVCSVEIPIIDYITESEAFKANCVEMAKEMVCQDYNSPSVIIWAYMNEAMLRVPFSKKEPEKRRHYFDSAVSLAKGIDEAIKGLDPYRPTMIPCDSSPEKYKESGVCEIPDIIGWNHYQGWYSRTVQDFDSRVQLAHDMFPDKPLIVTEYGAGIDPRIHSAKPVRFDFSMEHGLVFHKHYIEVIKNTPWIAGSNVWNLNDFYCEKRVDAVPHVNNKGLVGLDRKPKDTYLLYQANLLKEPFLAVGGRNWSLRGGNEGESFVQEVYTNAAQVTLYLNGKPVGSSSVSNGVASFIITPAAGWNTVAAETDGGLKDAVRFRYSAVPKDLSKFVEMCVSLGTDCQFLDEIQGSAWIPEQEYTPGSWGYVGGNRLEAKSGSSFLPGVSQDILGTINNPIFQTQRVGLEAFRADVPDGKYYVYLYFAELTSDSKGEPLPYNLGNDAFSPGAVDRAFNVNINGTQVLRDYDIRAEIGDSRAVIRKFEVNVRDGAGLNVSFEAVRDLPVLNAIRIYRCM